MLRSLLDSASLPTPNSKPYPYVVIKNALPDSLCDRLIASYPSYEMMGVNDAKSNSRWHYETCQVRANDGIAPEWKEVIDYFSSQTFFDVCIDLFSDSITQLYPHIAANKEELRKLRVGVKGIDDYNHCDVLLEAAIAGNTPVTEPSSVRVNHIDKPRKLLSGLLYLREDDDDSTGGDLFIRQFKKDYTQRKKNSCYRAVYVSENHTDLVETVNYEKNVLVLFVNSLESFHGVTVRNPTKYRRIFINIVCELQKPVFKFPNNFLCLMSRLLLSSSAIKSRFSRIASHNYE